MPYNPSQHIPLSKPMGAGAFPLDGKFMFYTNGVGGVFKYRPFVDVAEVLSYFPTNFRIGSFEILVNTGGTLSGDGGSITGGINMVYWFDNGTDDDDLKVKVFTDFDPSEFVKLNPSSPQDGVIYLDSENPSVPSRLRIGDNGASKNPILEISRQTNDAGTVPFFGLYGGYGFNSGVPYAEIIGGDNRGSDYSLLDIGNATGTMFKFNNDGSFAIETTPTTDATPTNILTWDATTKEVKKVDASSLGSNLTFDNGLTRTGDNVALGGSLTSNTIIDRGTRNFIVLTTSGSGGYLSMLNSGSIIGDNTGTAVQTIEFGVNNKIEIFDTLNDKGAEYAADYSANFTDRSLPDWAAVQGLVATGQTIGASTLGDAKTWAGNVYDASVNNSNLSFLLGYNGVANSFTYYSLPNIKAALATSLQDVATINNSATSIKVTTNDQTPTAVVRNEDIPFENYLASGTGASTTITIPHGLTGITSASKVIVQPLNAASAGVTFATIGSVNIVINYTIAPAAGTNNLNYSVLIKK